MMMMMMVFVICAFLCALFDAVYSQGASACDVGTFLIQNQAIVRCTPGAIVSPPLNQQPQLLSASCPFPYTCEQFSLTQQYYCCVGQVTSNFVCPVGSSVWMDQLSARPQRCVPNSIDQTCPRGYNCIYSATLRGSFCCSSLSNNFCASGTNPYVDPITNQPPTCQPGVFGTCPAYFTCQRSAQTNLNYCCPFIQDPQCPSGITDRGFCTPNRPNNCPQGYNCVYSFLTYRFVCCASGVPPFRRKRSLYSRIAHQMK